MVCARAFIFLAGVAEIASAAEMSRTQATCARIMEGSGMGMANQDEEDGRETVEACLKNLHMFWWPQDLPTWTYEQWCALTAQHKTGVEKADSPGLIPNMLGKTVLITGGDTGLGFATMKALAQSGAEVAYTSRHCDCETNPYSAHWPKQCQELKSLRALVQNAFSSPLKCYELDLLVGESVAGFIQAVRHDYGERGLDVLVNNAGLVDAAPTTGKVFNANLIGTYAVTKGLWNVLLATAQKGRDVRVVATSSVERLVLNAEITQQAFKIMETPGSDYDTALRKAQEYIASAVDDPSVHAIQVGYSFSKLADLLFAERLQDLINKNPDARGITVFTTHPGATHTLMTRNLDVGQMTRDQGCLPNLLAIAQDLDKVNKDYPNFIGPALNRGDMTAFIQLEKGKDDFLKQAQLAVKFGSKLLDDATPVEGMSCGQMVGAPMQYPSLRKVESDVVLQEQLWRIAEQGLKEVYGESWQRVNASWVSLHGLPATTAFSSERVMV